MSRTSLDGPLDYYREKSSCLASLRTRSHTPRNVPRPRTQPKKQRHQARRIKHHAGSPSASKREEEATTGKSSSFTKARQQKPRRHPLWSTTLTCLPNNRNLIHSSPTKQLIVRSLPFLILFVCFALPLITGNLSRSALIRCLGINSSSFDIPHENSIQFTHPRLQNVTSKQQAIHKQYPTQQRFFIIN